MSVRTGFLVKFATVPGTMMTVCAKMIGITPAVISRIGMKVFWPSRIRPRPMTFRGIWIGMRRAGGERHRAPGPDHQDQHRNQKYDAGDRHDVVPDVADTLDHRRPDPLEDRHGEQQG